MSDKSETCAIYESFPWVWTALLLLQQAAYKRENEFEEMQNLQLVDSKAAFRYLSCFVLYILIP